MNSEQKPVGRRSGWEHIETDYAYQSKTFRVRRDRLRLHDEEITYSYQERAEAVVVVAVDTGGQMILIRQYRYPVDEWCWEVPAGGLHDTGNRNLEEVVRKELQEEIGATSAEVEYINFFYPASSFSDEKDHVFLATDVVCEALPETEETESIEVHRKPVAEALAMLRRGEFKTGPCALAISLCEPRLRELYGL
jgi:ADP-ribose pyrophosphatase